MRGSIVNITVQPYFVSPPLIPNIYRYYILEPLYNGHLSTTAIYFGSKVFVVGVRLSGNCIYDFVLDLLEAHLLHSSIIQVPVYSYKSINKLTVCLWINAIRINGSSVQLKYLNSSSSKECLFSFTLTSEYIKVIIGSHNR